MVLEPVSAWSVKVGAAGADVSITMLRAALAAEALPARSVCRTCTLWLWLDLRFPGIYGQVDEVVDLRARLNDGIERQLKAKKPLWQARGGRRG